MPGDSHESGPEWPERQEPELQGLGWKGPVTVPADYADSSFDLATQIDWQVCDEICIPGAADFSLTLPVGSQATADPRWAEAFADARASLPLAAQDHTLSAEFNTHDGRINMMVQAPDARFEEIDEAWFFPLERRLMKYAPIREVMSGVI